MEVIYARKKILVFVEKANRSSPVLAARIEKTIDLLEEYGHTLGLPHSKSLGKGFFELRITGVKHVRIIYMFYRNVAYLLHIFEKKSKKISRRDMDYAMRVRESVVE